MTVPQPLVVKVGGSLSDRIPALAGIFLRSGRDLLVGPGGGGFADAVRAVKADDEASHWMAVAAMEQTGWLLVSAGLPPAATLRPPRGAEVYLPYCDLRRHDPLPHSWEITSDTIAAWVAGSLGCDLLVLKSVDGLSDAATLLSRVDAPRDCPEVDPAFLPFLFRHGISAAIINGRHEERVARALAGLPVTGTVVHPRL
ncbi:MAG: uridylate kinase [Methanomicrobiales archaeon]|nr:uridylate kinase [Methanomicrobiales archaeon]